MDYKKAMLLELVERWELAAQKPEYVENIETTEEQKGYAKGYSDCRAECAETLKIVLRMLNI